MIKYALMLLGSFIVRFFPLEFAYLLGRLFGRFAYWFFKDVRNAAERNFGVVFAEGLPASEMKRLSKSLFSHMALNAVDFLRFPYSTYPKPLAEIEGIDMLKERCREGKGVIVASPHLGNWEVGGMLLAQYGLSVNVVTESIKPRKTRFKEDRIAGLYRRYREAVDMKAIPLEQSGIKGFKALKRGEILVLLSDRDISGTGIEVEFFGMRGRIPKGPAVLSLRTGAPIFFGICVRGSNNRLHTFVEHLKHESKDLNEITGLLVKKMEKYIRQYPDQWFVFQPPWS